MLVVPLYLAMVGAVLQFDSSDSNGGSFPNIVHNQDFEVHLLVEFVGALVAGGFLVRHNFHDNYYGNQLVAFTLYPCPPIPTFSSGWLLYCGHYIPTRSLQLTMCPSTTDN